jgi:hypothetical protein
VPESGDETITEANRAALDLVPACIKIVRYAHPPKNLWANSTYLKSADMTLQAFLAQVRGCPSNPLVRPQFFVPGLRSVRTCVMRLLASRILAEQRGHRAAQVADCSVRRM